LRSIKVSKVRIGYEVVVVDNGSTDGSPEAIRNFQISNLNFQLIENEENSGFSRANNQGITASRGKYVLLLNSDTRVKAGSIEKLVEFAERTTNAGVIGARLLNEDGSVQPSCYQLPTLWRTIRQYWLGNGNILDKHTPSESGSCEVESVVGAAFLITPAARKTVGLLDERYFMFFEDMDYCRRVRRAGMKVYYLAEAEVVHYHGKSGRKLSGEADQWRRLIPSSRIYHGLLVHWAIWFVTWSGQKFFGR